MIRGKDMRIFGKPTFFTKVKKSAAVVAAGSFATLVVAAVVGQDEVADVCGSLFWTSIAGVGVGFIGEEVEKISK